MKSETQRNESNAYAPKTVHKNVSVCVRAYKLLQFTCKFDDLATTHVCVRVHGHSRNFAFYSQFFRSYFVRFYVFFVVILSFLHRKNCNIKTKYECGYLHYVVYGYFKCQQINKCKGETKFLNKNRKFLLKCQNEK